MFVRVGLQCGVMASKDGRKDMRKLEIYNKWKRVGLMGWKSLKTGHCWRKPGPGGQCVML